MALRYYDDIVAAKIKYWMPDNNALRVLKPDETKRLFETYADDKQDKPIQLPLIALSRSPDLELLLNIKNPRSFDGLKLEQSKAGTRQLNVIPVKLLYQMDIYTKTFEEADEYLRQYLFKLINNPKIHIDIPYNNTTYSHVAYIRVLSNIADTSNISERLFSGQFTRWTIQFEIQDAFFFSVPYKQNWKLYIDDADDFVVDPVTGEIYSPTQGQLEVADSLDDSVGAEVEPLPIRFVKEKNK